VSTARDTPVTPTPGRPAGAARPAAGGFTLLEVMVALAILAAAMLAASELTSTALRNHERAVHLETATLLARGKLAALQDTYDREGFRDFDQTDEGTFDREGHPEVRWKVEVVKPKIDLGAKQILALFAGATGKEGDNLDLSAILAPGADLSGDTGAGLAAAFPGGAAAIGPLQTQLTVVGEQLKKGLREVRLLVAWKDGNRDESFTVVTHVLAYPKAITPSGP
jgi:general secretion pathway protein I